MLVAMRNTVSGAAIIAAVAAQNFLLGANDYSTVSTVGSIPADLSVARSGNAMMYDSTGKLTYAPNNILTYSSTFSNAVWSKLNTSVTPGVTDPLGGTNAATISLSGSLLSQLSIDTAPIAFTPSDNAVFALWVKSSASGGASNIRLSTNNTAGWNTGQSTKFALTGSWQQIYISGQMITAGTQLNLSIGNITVAGALDATCAGNVDIAFATFSRVTYETTPRAGDQVVTTSAAYYGLRNDYNPATLAAKGVLIEGSRTNLLRYSNSLTTSGPTGWTPLNASIASAAVTTPDGTSNAFSLTDSGGGRHIVYYTGGTTLTNAVHTATVYAKQNTLRYMQLQLGATPNFYGAIFDLQTGTVTTSNSGGSATATSNSIQSVGNGWYRCSVSVNVGAITAYTVIACSNSATPTYDGDGNPTYTASGQSFYLFGAQLEASTFATSYTPTTTASVTRAAETLNLANYQNRLIEEFYIDEATGASYNSLSGPSATSPLAIFTGDGWVTSFRAYNSGAPGTLATPAWLDVSGITGNRMLYDSTGKLTYAPNNLIQRSNTFTNAAWTAASLTVADNATVSPDSNTNAGSIITNNGASFVAASNATTTAVVGNYYYVSLYVKANGFTSVNIRFSGAGDNNRRAEFLLSGAGSVTSTGTAVVGTPSITALANGWYLCGFKVVCDATLMSIGIFPGTWGQVGNGTNGIYVYNAVTAAVTYETSPRSGDQVITTSAAYCGPRFDFDPNTLAARGLLIEESRVNVFTQSVDMSNAAWSNSGVTVTKNVTGPDGVANSGITLAAAAGGNTSTGVFQTTTVANGRTISIYAKAGTANWLAIATFNGATSYAYFNLSTGATGTTVGGVASTQNVGNGWWRCNLTINVANANTVVIFNVKSADPGVGDPWTTGSTAAGQSILLYGPQNELGAFPTSYIPTTTASVTRVADIIKLSGAALTARQGTAWTIVSESNLSTPSFASNPVLFGTTATTAIYAGSNNTVTSYDGVNGGGSTATAGSGGWNTTARFAFGADASSRSVSMSGGAVSTAGNGFGSVVTDARLGDYPSGGQPGTGWYRGWSIYNQKLSDATLQAKSVVGSAY